MLIFFDYSQILKFLFATVYFHYSTIFTLFSNFFIIETHLMCASRYMCISSSRIITIVQSDTGKYHKLVAPYYYECAA